MRNRNKIDEEYNRYWDKVWYTRHMALLEPAVGQEKARKVEERLGKEFLHDEDEFAQGEALGIMKALAWVLGAEWDEAGDT